MHSIARIQREGRLATQMPLLEDFFLGAQASVWQANGCQSERQAGSSHLMYQSSLLPNKGFMRPSFSQDKRWNMQGYKNRENDSSLIGGEKQGDSPLEGLGTLCGLFSHVGPCRQNFEVPFLSDEIRADSVRRKRKKKMNKHKHAKRRKLNRHRR